MTGILLALLLTFMSAPCLGDEFGPSLVNKSDEVIQIELTPLPRARLNLSETRGNDAVLENEPAFWPGEDPSKFLTLNSGHYPGAARKFVIPPRSTITPRCIRCTGLMLDGYTKTIRIWDSLTLGGGQAYEFTRLGYTWEIKDIGTGRLVQASAWSRIEAKHSPWRKTLLTNTSSESVVVLLRKTGLHSSWDYYQSINIKTGIPEFATEYTKIHLGPKESKIVNCGNCLKISVEKIDGLDFRRQLRQGAYYLISVNSGEYSISRSFQAPLKQQGSGAPPSAAGLVYVVNGQSGSISLDFYTAKSAVESKALQGGEGVSLRCPICILRIGTGPEYIERTVTAGRSYIIVWDRGKSRYDLRVFSH